MLLELLENKSKKAWIISNDWKVNNDKAVTLKNIMGMSRIHISFASLMFRFTKYKCANYHKGKSFKSK